MKNKYSTSIFNIEKLIFHLVTKAGLLNHKCIYPFNIVCLILTAARA